MPIYRENVESYARDAANRVCLDAPPPDESSDWLIWAADDEGLYRGYCPDVHDQSDPDYQEEVDEWAPVFGDAFRARLRERVGASVREKLHLESAQLNALYTNAPVDGFTGEVVAAKLCARFGIASIDDLPDAAGLTPTETTWFTDQD